MSTTEAGKKKMTDLPDAKDGTTKEEEEVVAATTAETKTETPPKEMDDEEQQQKARAELAKLLAQGLKIKEEIIVSVRDLKKYERQKYERQHDQAKKALEDKVNAIKQRHAKENAMIEEKHKQQLAELEQKQKEEMEELMTKHEFQRSSSSSQ